MSESLKEKAKTFYELGKEWMETKLVDDRNNEKWILVSVAQQEIDDCRTEATKELLNLAIHGLKEAQNGESSDCVSTFATIIEKLGIHVEYDEWHEPIIDVEQVKTVLEGNEKEKAKP